MVTQHADVQQVLRANNDAFERNIRAQDANQLVDAFYTADAFVLPQDHPLITGHAQIHEFWQGMFTNGLKDASLEIVHAEASGDLAYEIGQYTLTVGSAQARGKYLVVHRRQADGSWKAVVDMFSSNG